MSYNTPNIPSNPSQQTNTQDVWKCNLDAAIAQQAGSKQTDSSTCVLVTGTDLHTNLRAGICLKLLAGENRHVPTHAQQLQHEFSSQHP